MHRVPLPITTYIQKEQLKKEFLYGLQNRKIDEKFSYIGEQQANAWVALCNAPEYAYYRNSKQLLEHCIQDFLANHKGDVNVIVLGPGNALKEKIVVNHLRERHRVNLFFVDISREMLTIAIKNTEDSDVLKEVFIADLTNFTDIKNISQYVKNHYSTTNFFTLLGNTLGNYPQAIMLKTLRNAMEPGDKVLIDCRVTLAGNAEEETSQIAKMIKEYNNPIFRELLLGSLSKAHIEATDGTIEVEFDSDEFFPQIDMVKQYFRFNRDKTITYCGEDIYFAKGECILVGYSNKYTFESLKNKNIVTSHGFRIIKHTTDATKKYYQLLCELA